MMRGIIERGGVRRMNVTMLSGVEALGGKEWEVGNWKLE